MSLNLDKSCFFGVDLRRGPTDHLHTLRGAQDAPALHQASFLSPALHNVPDAYIRHLRSKCAHALPLFPRDPEEAKNLEFARGLAFKAEPFMYGLGDAIQEKKINLVNGINQVFGEKIKAEMDKKWGCWKAVEKILDDRSYNRELSRRTMPVDLESDRWADWEDSDDEDDEDFGIYSFGEPSSIQEPRSHIDNKISEITIISDEENSDDFKNEESVTTNNSVTPCPELCDDISSDEEPPHCTNEPVTPSPDVSDQITHLSWEIPAKKVYLDSLIHIRARIMAEMMNEMETNGIPLIIASDNGNYLGTFD
jgi:hypothetical protein